MRLQTIVEDIVDALQPLTVEFPGLQIVPLVNQDPSPPSIDVYPDEEFLTSAGFGIGQMRSHWIVRARVTADDVTAGQWLLLRLLDPSEDMSVQALLEDTLDIHHDNITGFTAGQDGLVEAQWRGSVFL